MTDWNAEYEKHMGGSRAGDADFWHKLTQFNARREGEDESYRKQMSEMRAKWNRTEASALNSEEGVYGRRITVEIFAKNDGEEVKTDFFELEDVVGDPKIGLRSPIFVNIATSSDVDIVNGLFSEIGLQRAFSVSELIAADVRMRSKWANTPEKVEALGGSAQKVTAVRVWYNTPEGRKESVTIEDSDLSAEHGYLYGELDSPQSSSIQDAVAVGNMYLHSDQDPSVYPLIRVNGTA